MTPYLRYLIRITVACALALAVAACGSDDTPADSTTDDPAFDDALWGEEFAMGASRGAVMVVGDDVFRLGVVSINGDEAQLEILHSVDRDENRLETVNQGDRFVVGDYRIRVGTVGSDGVVAMWALRQSD